MAATAGIEHAGTLMGQVVRSGQLYHPAKKMGQSPTQIGTALNLDQGLTLPIFPILSALRPMISPVSGEVVVRPLDPI